MKRMAYVMAVAFLIVVVIGCQTYEGPRAMAPFTAEQANYYQQLTAKYLHEPVEKEIDLGNGVKLTIVLIPAGEFMMGLRDNEQHEYYEVPQHRVIISQPFWIGKYEVTQKQWQAVMGYLPWLITGNEINPDHPISHVSWLEANEYCQKLNSIYRDSIIRLPTEAEWEYACRAGTTTSFNTGDNLSSEQANYWLGANEDMAITMIYTKHVGSYPSNSWKIFDMHGNILEWCFDWFDDKMDSSRNSVTVDPKGPKTGFLRINRGGCWRSSPKDCRSAKRSADGIDMGSQFFGFRIVMNCTK